MIGFGCAYPVLVRRVPILFWRSPCLRSPPRAPSMRRPWRRNSRSKIAAGRCATCLFPRRSERVEPPLDIQKAKPKPQANQGAPRAAGRAADRQSSKRRRTPARRPGGRRLHGGRPGRRPGHRLCRQPGRQDRRAQQWLVRLRARRLLQLARTDQVADRDRKAGRRRRHAGLQRPPADEVGDVREQPRSENWTKEYERRTDALGKAIADSQGAVPVGRHAGLPGCRR